MSNTRTWLVANWKMHGLASEAADYAFRVNQALGQAPSNIAMVFCPPSILIPAAVHALPGNARLGIGAQNCHAAEKGAFTGEISAPMLADAKVGYVILGHSERRALCHETCAQVRAKADAALAAGLTPILCVGETRDEREAGKTQTVLEKQMQAFAGLDAGAILIAYEPVWAIGSGHTPTTKEIAAAHSTIKSALGSDGVVLYGGSVKSTNLREILDTPGVSGALIGAASLDAGGMETMLSIAAEKGNER